MYKLFAFIFVSLSTSVSLQAQTIKGKVIDTNGEPIEFATAAVILEESAGPVMDYTSFLEASTDLIASKLVFTIPAGKGSITAGTEVTAVATGEKYEFSDSIIGGSDYISRESNIAGFAEYGVMLPIGQLSLGLRYEHVDFSHENSFRQDENIRREQDNWFPSVSFSTKIGQVGLQLSYTNKTERPSFYMMSSEVSYQNRFIHSSFWAVIVVFSKSLVYLKKITGIIMKRIISTIVGTLLLSFTCFGQFYIEYEQNFRSEENSLNFIYNLTSGKTTSVPASPLLAEVLPVPGYLPVPGPFPAVNNASGTAAETPVYASAPEPVYAVAETPLYEAAPEPVEPVAGPEPVIITEQVLVPDPVTVVLDPIVITEPVYLTEKVIEYTPVASPAPVVIPKPVESVATVVPSAPDASQLLNILQNYDPDQLSEILQEADILDHLLKPRYRMYRTVAASVLLKLDTATGAVWQVQQGDGASRPMVSPIDAKSLLRYSEPEESGRYELCPTDNSYSFILLDTKTGYSYQVKWGEDANSRARILIGR